MGVPVALKGHQHVCPLPKHVGGPIKEGDPGLTVNGIPVAVMGSQTVHGGVVIQGDPGLIIG